MTITGNFFLFTYIWHPWGNIFRPHARLDISGGILGSRALDAELEEAIEVARRQAVHLACHCGKKAAEWTCAKPCHKYGVVQQDFIQHVIGSLTVHQNLSRTNSATLNSQRTHLDGH